MRAWRRSRRRRLDRPPGRRLRSGQPPNLDRPVRGRRRDARERGRARQLLVGPDRRGGVPGRSFETGGAQSIGFAVSRDAGRTWKSGILPALTTASRPRGQFSRASDPSVAYDALHGVWLIASLGFSDNESALLVSASPDGLHWSDPYVAGRKPNGQTGILFDKEWIACDNGSASPFRGRCYLSYSDIEQLRLATQTSFDGGTTWSAPVGSADNAGRRGIEGPSGSCAAARLASERRPQRPALRRRALRRSLDRRRRHVLHRKPDCTLALLLFERSPLRPVPERGGRRRRHRVHGLARLRTSLALHGERPAPVHVHRRARLDTADEDPAQLGQPCNRRAGRRSDPTGPDRGRLLHGVLPQARRPDRFVLERRRHVVA